jgi:hypothetical protein
MKNGAAETNKKVEIKLFLRDEPLFAGPEESSW